MRDYYAAIHPYSGSEGGYINFMADGDDHHRVEADYASNYAELAQVNAAYDPGNLFHLSHNNITPAPGRAEDNAHA